jgi:hypothetical protein
MNNNTEMQDFFIDAHQAAAIEQRHLSGIRIIYRHLPAVAFQAALPQRLFRSGAPDAETLVDFGIALEILGNGAARDVFDR